MPEQIDPNAGKGGSYEMQPDGSRILLSRTTEQSSAISLVPTDPAAEPLPPLQRPAKPLEKLG